MATILLVAGRVDHKGEEVSLLADLAVDWDGAAAAGEEAFARQVAAGDRSGGRRGGNGNGNGYANGRRNGGVPSAAPGGAGRPLVPVGPGQPVGVPVAAGGPQDAVTAVPFVSPRRGGGGGGPDGPDRVSLPAIAPAEPVSTYPETSGAAGGPDRDEEPAVPDEARARIVADASADAPVDAGPDTTLHVRFAGHAASDRVIGAMETIKTVLLAHPGATKVIIHIPSSSPGSALPMELRRGVAYDAELLAEVRRRLGEGLVELRLA